MMPWLPPVCCICHDPLQKDLRVNRACGHVFHAHCINLWISRATRAKPVKCPICRAGVTEKALIKLQYEFQLGEECDGFQQDHMCSSAQQVEIESLKTEQQKARIRHNEELEKERTKTKDFQSKLESMRREVIKIQAAERLNVKEIKKLKGELEKQSARGQYLTDYSDESLQGLRKSMNDDEALSFVHHGWQLDRRLKSELEKRSSKLENLYVEKCRETCKLEKYLVQQIELLQKYANQGDVPGEASNDRKPTLPLGIDMESWALDDDKRSPSGVNFSDADHCFMRKKPAQQQSNSGNDVSLRGWDAKLRNISARQAGNSQPSDGSGLKEPKAMFSTVFSSSNEATSTDSAHATVQPTATGSNHDVKATGSTSNEGLNLNQSGGTASMPASSKKKSYDAIANKVDEVSSSDSSSTKRSVRSLLKEQRVKGNWFSTFMKNANGNASGSLSSAAASSVKTSLRSHTRSTSKQGRDLEDSFPTRSSSVNSSSSLSALPVPTKNLNPIDSKQRKVEQEAAKKSSYSLNIVDSDSDSEIVSAKAAATSRIFKRMRLSTSSSDDSEDIEFLAVPPSPQSAFALKPLRERLKRNSGGLSSQFGDAEASGISPPSSSSVHPPAERIFNHLPNSRKSTSSRLSPAHSGFSQPHKLNSGENVAKGKFRNCDASGSVDDTEKCHSRSIFSENLSGRILSASAAGSRFSQPSTPNFRSNLNTSTRQGSQLNLSDIWLKAPVFDQMDQAAKHEGPTASLSSSPYGAQESGHVAVGSEDFEGLQAATELIQQLNDSMERTLNLQNPAGVAADNGGVFASQSPSTTQRFSAAQNSLQTMRDQKDLDAPGKFDSLNNKSCGSPALNVEKTASDAILASARVMRNSLDLHSTKQVSDALNEIEHNTSTTPVFSTERAHSLTTNDASHPKSAKNSSAVQGTTVSTTTYKPSSNMARIISTKPNNQIESSQIRVGAQYFLNKSKVSGVSLPVPNEERIPTVQPNSPLLHDVVPRSASAVSQTIGRSIEQSAPSSSSVVPASTMNSTSSILHSASTAASSTCSASSAMNASNPTASSDTKKQTRFLASRYFSQTRATSSKFLYNWLGFNSSGS